MFRFLMLSIVTALCAGCGQKGPLYLPDDGAPKAQEQAGE
ncbi:LPS translocon maturation chaperone LptM [Cardiobacterium hominis]|nr:lipoprotein [Cardiobacterium hominis]